MSCVPRDAATLLAYAGLKRLEMAHVATAVLEQDVGCEVASSSPLFDPRNTLDHVKVRRWVVLAVRTAFCIFYVVKKKTRRCEASTGCPCFLRIPKKLLNVSYVRDIFPICLDASKQASPRKFVF